LGNFGALNNLRMFLDQVVLNLAVPVQHFATIINISVWSVLIEPVDARPDVDSAGLSPFFILGPKL
jgi:hypothetical protein